MILNNFFKKILVLLIIINVNGTVENINEYIHSYTDIVINIYPSSYGSPPPNSTYNFIVGADGILTVNYNNEIKTTNLTNDDINNITYILKKIYENEDDLIFEGFFDSWTMSICYNHKEIKLNCWHYDSSKNLIDLLKRISPINIDLYGFS